jgi:hypothetical protein
VLELLEKLPVLDAEAVQAMMVLADAEVPGSAVVSTAAVQPWNRVAEISRRVSLVRPLAFMIQDNILPVFLKQLHVVQKQNSVHAHHALELA